MRNRNRKIPFSLSYSFLFNLQNSFIIRFVRSYIIILSSVITSGVQRFFPLREKKRHALLISILRRVMTFPFYTHIFIFILTLGCFFIKRDCRNEYQTDKLIQLEVNLITQLSDYKIIVYIYKRALRNEYCAATFLEVFLLVYFFYLSSNKQILYISSFCYICMPYLFW